MNHKLYRVTNFQMADGHALVVRFDDNTEQLVDFGPVLYGEMWEPLRDPALFSQVSIDPIATR